MPDYTHLGENRLVTALGIRLRRHALVRRVFGRIRSIAVDEDRRVPAASHSGDTHTHRPCMHAGAHGRTDARTHSPARTHVMRCDAMRQDGTQRDATRSDVTTYHTAPHPNHTMPYAKSHPTMPHRATPRHATPRHARSSHAMPRHTMPRVLEACSTVGWRRELIRSPAPHSIGQSPDPWLQACQSISTPIAEGPAPIER